MSEQPDTNWPVSWSAVKEAQLKTWLRATPAQRLAWMEEMLNSPVLQPRREVGRRKKKRNRYRNELQWKFTKAS